MVSSASLSIVSLTPDAFARVSGRGTPPIVKVVGNEITAVVPSLICGTPNSALEASVERVSLEKRYTPFRSVTTV